MKWGIICFAICNFNIVKMGFNKRLNTVSSGILVTILCNFLNNPIVLLILLSLSVRSSWKSSLVSKIIPCCLCVFDWMTTRILKFNAGWFGLLGFLEKITSWVCLLDSGFNLILNWNTYLFIFFRSSNSLLIK